MRPRLVGDGAGPRVVTEKTRVSRKPGLKKTPCLQKTCLCLCLPTSRPTSPRCWRRPAAPAPMARHGCPGPDEAPDQDSLRFMPAGAEPGPDDFPLWLARRRREMDTGADLHWCIADTTSDAMLGNVQIFRMVRRPAASRVSSATGCGLGPEGSDSSAKRWGLCSSLPSPGRRRWAGPHPAARRHRQRELCIPVDPAIGRLHAVGSRPPGVATHRRITIRWQVFRAVGLPTGCPHPTGGRFRAVTPPSPPRRAPPD